jgi:hypothetical protein
MFMEKSCNLRKNIGPWIFGMKETILTTTPQFFLNWWCKKHSYNIHHNLNKVKLLLLLLFAKHWHCFVIVLNLMSHLICFLKTPPKKLMHD